MKDRIIKFGILVLLIFLSNSCKVNSQVFGYGEECENENAIEFSKIIYECIGDERLSLMLKKHTNYDGLIVAFLRVNNEGKIISARVRSISEELTTAEIDNMASKLCNSKYRFKKCVNDLYFKTDEKTLLKRAIENYNGQDLPIGILFPGNLLKDYEGDSVINELKKRI